MIVVTGAAGFIGSNLIQRLNQDNYNAIIAVDKFNNEAKNQNLVGAKIKERIDMDLFLTWLDTNYETVEFIFHIGAQTDTADFDIDLWHSLNTEYTKEIWKRCCKYQLPLVYASSAATYESGEFGYDDEPLLKPLNPYGVSKQEFDVWALQQMEKPFFWVGLKFHIDFKKEYQSQEFLFVREIAETCLSMMRQRKNSGVIELSRSSPLI